MKYNDMKLNREKAINKVKKAIEDHKGTTLLSTGITGDDARLAKAAVDAGARLIEPNHPAVALARGYKGVTNMHDAENIRHEIKLEQMLEVTQGVRNVVGEDIFITVGLPGGFTEVKPVELTDEDFKAIALSGADGLHCHKSSIEDLKEFVGKAHKYGLLVDAYIGHPTDKHTFGVSAETPEDVKKVVKQMEEVGVDMIGLMTGMSYEGVEAGRIHPKVEERVRALVETATVPTLAEGGINIDNYKAFKDVGVNIIVVGTAIDKMVEAGAKKAVETLLFD